MKLAWIVNRLITDNIGDQLIGISHKRLLKKIGYQVTQFEYQGHNRNKKLTYLDRAIWKLLSPDLFYFLKVIRTLPTAIKAAPDVITIGGGQLLLQRPSCIPPLLAWYLVARIIGAKFVLFSVGLEAESSTKKIRNFIYRKITKLVVQKADDVYVRDIETKLFLKRVGCTRNLRISPDCAYSSVNHTPEVLQRSGVILTLANRKIFEHYNVNGASWYEHIENICLKVKEHLGDNENLYLAHTTAPDFESQSEILNDLNKFLNINILHFPKQLDLDEYINLASSSRLIIASRMHALIIGEISGAEAAPIIINKKLLNYSSNLGDRNTTQLSSELWLCAKEAYEW